MVQEESKLFKDVFFNEAFIDSFSKALQRQIPSFSRKKFEKLLYDETWQHKELKQRTRHLTQTLHSFLPENFPDAAKIIMALAKDIQQSRNGEPGFGYICLAEYIELYGLEHFKEAVAAMEVVTTLISCEFAVRPFIIKYDGKMMRQMERWATHKDPKVRRLATEGCRPRLPWAIALPKFKKDASTVLPILEILKADEDIWVRKSVANNLNDISKDHPELLLSIAKKWKGRNKNTDWILKHASRTLLKQGNQDAMSLFGFAKDERILLNKFEVVNKNVKVGDELMFSFSLKQQSGQPQKIRLEYAVYFNTARNILSKKVFKISEREYLPEKAYPIVKKHSFRQITTRKYYPGQHKVGIIINGHEVKTLPFNLLE